MNAVIYARYSSDSQREESIEGQLRECREYAERNDMTVVGLKSRTIDLSLYSGMIVLQGTVEKEFNDLFIVEVVSVSGSLAET